MSQPFSSFHPLSLNSFSLLFLLLVVAAGVVYKMLRVPNKSSQGVSRLLTTDQKELRSQLQSDVSVLAKDIGERNMNRYRELTAAAKFLERSFLDGGYRPRRDSYIVDGHPCHNIEAELSGTGAEIIVIGAHYDTAPGTPGANDNGSGVAAMLALSRKFSGKVFPRTLRFVAFVNEEPGYFHSELMGSWVYASRCKNRHERIVAMLSLETIGYFSQEPGSQDYPMSKFGKIYPNVGNFIAFVGNLSSRPLVEQTVASFRRHIDFPCEGVALPTDIPGVGWSDHWSFWQFGYPATTVQNKLILDKLS